MEFDAISEDEEKRIPKWFEMLKVLRNDAISYDHLYNTERFRNPVRRVCRLLGVEKISDIVNDEILYHAVVRVAEMETESIDEKDSIMDGLALELSIKPLQKLRTTSTYELSEAEMFTGRTGAQLHRPKALTAMLTLMTNAVQQADDSYSRFLHLADTSRIEGANASIGLTTSYMYTAPEAIKQILQNSSLLEIFSSYSTLLNTAAHKLLDTPTSAEEGKAVLNLHEYLQFGDDFEIYPRLISKSDFKLLWSAMSMGKDKKMSGSIPGLNLNNFKNVLVRIALFAYHKKSTKDLILKLNNNIMPSHIELVEYLCRYLHLDDQNWVRAHIKKCFGHLKKTEICTFGISDLKIVKTPKSVNPPKKTNHKITKTQKLSKPESFNINTLPFIKERLKVREDLKELISPEEVMKTMPIPVEELFQTMRRTDFISDDMESESSLQTPMTPVRIVTINEITDEQKHFMTCNLDVATLRCFKKYLHDSSDHYGLQWSYPGGNFVDLGCLPNNTECVIRIGIINRGSDEIYLSTSCQGFESSDIRVISEPSPLIPGLKKTIRVLFTVEQGNRATVGNVQILSVDVRTGVSYTINCPVHYRTGPPNPERDDCPCTVHNLTQLLVKATGLPRIDTVTFEAKKIKLVESDTYHFPRSNKLQNNQEDVRSYTPSSMND